MTPNKKHSDSKNNERKDVDLSLLFYKQFYHFLSKLNVRESVGSI